MTLPIKATPFWGIDTMRRDMDRLFGALARPFPTFPPLEGEAWIPALDVFEKDEEMVIRLDLPGMEKKDVKVRVLDDVLTIEGERKLEKEVDEKDYLCREMAYGEFTRRIALPNPVEEYEVKATFKNGILEIRVPVRIETDKPKEIPIH